MPIEPSLDLVFFQLADTKQFPMTVRPYFCASMPEEHQGGKPDRDNQHRKDDKNQPTWPLTRPVDDKFARNNLRAGTASCSPRIRLHNMDFSPIMCPDRLLVNQELTI